MAADRTSRSDRPIIIVHGLDDARAAVAAARELATPILLRSAPGAAAYAGAGWWDHLIRNVADEMGSDFFEASLDCGDRAGDALDALGQGLKLIRFTGRRDVREKIAAIARKSRARLDEATGRALDLAATDDPDAACRVWIGDNV